MKKGLLLLVLILTLSGCMKIDNNIDKLVNNIIVESTKVNNVSNSYKYYLPIGVSNVTNHEFNGIFKYNNNNLYLYVDIVSYFYKNNLNFNDNENYNYYYKDISKEKKGFIGINKEENVYEVRIVYNYSKIEFFSNEEDLESSVAVALIILNNIDYNDLVIEDLINTGGHNSKDILYEIDKPENAESKFSQYLEEYVSEEDVYEKLPDE